jgi:hypothetical protein
LKVKEFRKLHSIGNLYMVLDAGAFRGDADAADALVVVGVLAAGFGKISRMATWF